MGNLTLREESDRTGAELRRVQANFEVACENIKAAQQENTLLRAKIDQVSRGNLCHQFLSICY